MFATIPFIGTLIFLLVKGDYEGVAAVLTALTPIALGVIAIIQLHMNQRMKRQDDERQKLIGTVSNIEHMATRNTRKIHGEEDISQETKDPV